MRRRKSRLFSEFLPTVSMRKTENWTILIPLVTGTAASNSLTLPSRKTSPFVKFSKPYVYDNVFFIIGPADVLAEGGIRMLKDPLDLSVWVALLVSSLVISGASQPLKPLPSTARDPWASVGLGWWILSLCPYCTDRWFSILGDSVCELASMDFILYWASGMYVWSFCTAPTTWSCWVSSLTLSYKSRHGHSENWRRRIMKSGLF